MKVSTRRHTPCHSQATLTPSEHTPRPFITMVHSFRYKLPLLMMLAACLLVHYSVVGQVTFSRDWTAGKRSLSSGLNSDCAPNIKSTLALCQMLHNELRQLTSCEIRNHLMLTRQAINSDDSPLDPGAPFSSDSHSGR